MKKLLLLLSLIFILICPKTVSASSGWTVSGAGSSSYDGNYIPDGACGGKTLYRKDASHWLYWSNVPSAWVLDDTACAVQFFTYRGTAGLELPATPWQVAFDGALPVPSFSEYTIQEVTTIVVSPTLVELHSGEGYSFSAKAYDALGQEMSGISFSWEVINGGGSITNSGYFTAGSIVGNFSNTVRANSGTAFGYATVSVNSESTNGGENVNSTGSTQNTGNTGTSTGSSSGSATNNSTITPNSTDSQSDSNILENISSIKLSENNEIINESKSSNSFIDKISDSSVAKSIALTTAATLAAAGGIAFSLGALAAQLSIKDYLLILINYIISAFSFKKKDKYGFVYDESTGKPVEKALIQLYDRQNIKLVASALTDKFGHYFFTVKPGEYALSVIKPGFVFPSKMAQRTLNISKRYIGQTIVIKENSAVNAIIPIDPSSQIDKRFNKSSLSDYMIILRYSMLILGTLMSFYSLGANQSNFGYIIVVGFLILWLFEFIIQSRSLSFSRVLDHSNKKPISLAIIRAVSNSGKLLETFVADNNGMVLPKTSSRGDKLIIEKVGYAESQISPDRKGLIEKKIFLLNRN